MSATYVCRICGEDLRGAVALEVEQQLDVLRVWRDPQTAAAQEWSVRVYCRKDHENVFSGSGDV